jgi:hypothetical protein
MYTEKLWLKSSVAGLALLGGLAMDCQAVTFKLESGSAIHNVAITYSKGGTYINETVGACMMDAMDTSNGSHVYTFCTDIGRTINWGSSYSYSLVSFAGQSGSSPTWSQNGIKYAEYLYQTYLSDALSNQSSGKGAALQLAIWEVLYDTKSSGSQSYSLTSGYFKASSDVNSIAQSYLNSIPTSIPNYAGNWYRPSPLCSAQGLIAMPDGGASMAMLGIGLAGMGALRRRMA